MGLSPAALSLPALAASGFLVSLATVAVPGPITLVASRLAISRHVRHAVWFLAGVTSLDVALFAALATGAAPALSHVGAMPLVELAGGLALLAGGAISLRRPVAQTSAPVPAVEVETSRGSFLLGIAVAAGNPHYWIWWVTAGLAFVEAARTHGPLGLTVMLAALVGGVVTFYVPLLWALKHGRQLLSARASHRIERLLGGLLVLMGAGLIALGAWRLGRR